MLSLAIQNWPDLWANLSLFFLFCPFSPSFLLFSFLCTSSFSASSASLPPSCRIHTDKTNVPINPIPPQECLRNYRYYSIARLMVTTTGMHPTRT